MGEDLDIIERVFISLLDGSVANVAARRMFGNRFMTEEKRWVARLVFQYETHRLPGLI